MLRGKPLRIREGVVRGQLSNLRRNHIMAVKKAQTSKTNATTKSPFTVVHAKLVGIVVDYKVDGNRTTLRFRTKDGVLRYITCQTGYETSYLPHHFSEVRGQEPIPYEEGETFFVDYGVKNGYKEWKLHVADLDDPDFDADALR